MGVDQDHGARAAFVAQQMQKEGLLEWLDPEDDYWRLIEALTVHSSGYTTKDLVSARVGTLIVSPWYVLGYRSIRLCCAASIGGLSHLAVRGMLLYAQRITEEQDRDAVGSESWNRSLDQRGSNPPIGRRGRRVSERDPHSSASCLDSWVWLLPPPSPDVAIWLWWDA